MLRVGGQMEIGEKHLAFAQAKAFGGLRLLDLDHEVRPAENRFRILDDGGAAGAIALRATTDDQAGRALDANSMAASGQLAHGRRHQADAIFVILDLLWNPNAHRNLPLLHA